MLQGKDVWKRFSGLEALRGVSFDVRPGEIVGLIGPNGAGKTTLLNVITGTIRADSGRIIFQGDEITGLKPNAISKLGIARTFQNSQSFPDLSVLENVMVSSIFGNSRKQSNDEATEESMKSLSFVGLAEKAAAKAKNLGINELKRLEVARALASKPKLLLLDEPSTGLNPTETKEAVRLIQEISRMGITILIVEHVMRVIMSLCDRIVVLHHGQKLFEGTPREVAADVRVIEAYLGERYFL